MPEEEQEQKILRYTKKSTYVERIQIESSN